MAKSKSEMEALTIDEVYLFKRSKVIIPSDNSGCSTEFVATANRNLEGLGYTFSKALFDHLATCSESAVAELYVKLLPLLKKFTGASRRFKPMYPNFPAQVMEMDESKLYVNAMLHYWGSAISDAVGDPSIVLLPESEKEERQPLDEKVKLKVIDLGSMEDFHSILTNLAGSNASLSTSDRNILMWMCQTFDARSLLPESIPQKEILASLVVWLDCPDYLTSRLKTATDVLRVAVALSGGDVSLATKTKFKSLKKSVRRFLLSALENCKVITEDMLRYPEVWKRLGHNLHPGDYKFKKVNEAFDIVRNDKPFATYNSKVESAILNGEIKSIIALLSERPGVFARRLDHVLRTSPQSKVAKAFLEVAPDVATPLLLQVHHHFKTRNSQVLRAYMPKGSVAKVQVDETPLPELDPELAHMVSTGTRRVLVNRFAELPALGKVYLDDDLRDYVVPVSQRSASKALRTLARGSRIDLPDGDCIRFFLWWKNGQDRTDIDLSGSIYDAGFRKVSDIAFYNLKDWGCCHSGDITSAPNGACEFIDFTISKLIERRGRYVIMALNSYTSQPYCDLPECFAGWMVRQQPQSGEVFEAKTVQNKVDLAANTTVCAPVVIDLVKRKVIWADLALANRAVFNTVRGNSNSFTRMLKAVVHTNRPSLYDLFSMHVEARGKAVARSKAQKIFSPNEGDLTAFDTDRITSEFLA